jgi:prepilin-type processing-associated H-X9-DG protein
MYMDTITHYVYSPADPQYRFSLDMNGDTKPDTMARYPDTAFNSGRPTVHAGGANVTLLDGHAERVSYKLLWDATSDGKPIHSYWYIED